MNKTAFSHDQPSTDINPVTGKGIPKLISSAPKVIALIIIIVVGVYMIRSSLKSSWKESSKSLGDQQEQTTSESGVFLANTQEWTGKTCLDYTKRIDFSILRDDIEWEIRLDQRNDRIHPLYAKNNPFGVPHLEITNDFNTMEARIKPNPITNRVPIAWSIGPRKKLN